MIGKHPICNMVDGVFNYDHTHAHIIVYIAGVLVGRLNWGEWGAYGGMHPN